MNDRAEQIVGSLAPDRLRQIILELSKAQSSDDPGIMVNRIIDDLAKGEDLGSGTEGWQAFLRIRQAIRDTVALIPGMKYVEADS